VPRVDTAAGVGHLCPVCGRSLPRFGPGPGGRANAACPHCGSLERHRLLSFVVGGAAPLLASASALQVGPAGAITPILTGAAPHVSVHTVDAATADDGHHADRLPFADDSFDLAVCTQVFDGPGADRLARELARVLRAGGVAVVYDSTDASGQLEAAGLAVGRLRVAELARPEVSRLLGLATADAVWIARAVVHETTGPGASGPGGAGSGKSGLGGAGSGESGAGRQLVADWLGAALVGAEQARAAAATENEILTSRLTALEASLLRRAERAERAASSAQGRYDALRGRLPLRLASVVQTRTAALRRRSGHSAGPRGTDGRTDGTGPVH
jgi:hypothetical protein